MSTNDKHFSLLLKISIGAKKFIRLGAEQNENENRQLHLNVEFEYFTNQEQLLCSSNTSV